MVQIGASLIAPHTHLVETRENSNACQLGCFFRERSLLLGMDCFAWDDVAMPILQVCILEMDYIRRTRNLNFSYAGYDGA
mmetsp:Transcript_38747/g.75243  ORF Transcript_38747/g.75243 Transcript_38747/m.75243 type:complete len:80 (-) Transcript_38747:221-460(-)